MRHLALLVMMAMLAGCVSVTKGETGSRAVGNRMTVHLEGPWNHINVPGMGPAETWTMDGLMVDRLMFYSGIRDGQVVHPEVGPGNQKLKSFSFKSSMQPDEIVAMFEGMLTRDGSTFKLSRLEPAGFGGLKGFRFEYFVTRKSDNVQLSGFGYSAVSKGELFAVLYMAPRLGFYPRHAGHAEKIGQSAVIKE
jgi:hypothetical protein